MSKKYDQDEAIQLYVEKKVAAAVKAERKRAAMALKEMQPAFGSKKEAGAFMKSVKATINNVEQL